MKLSLISATRLAAGVGCGVLVLAAPVSAFEPATLPVGNLAFTPTLDVGLGHTDNLFNNAGDNTTSTLFSRVRPNFNLQGEKDSLVAGINYAFEHGSFFSSHADDYTDHVLSGYATAQFGSRKKLDLLAEYSKFHDARSDARSGNSFTTAQIDAPTKYTVQSLGATFTYGADDATGQIVVKGQLDDREYDNFRTLTESRDRQTQTLTGTFYYRIAPKTRLLTELRLRDIDYDLSSVTLDSKESRLQVGAEWDATAKTAGRAKFGVVRKDFADDARDTQTNSSWEVGVSWAPRTYSVFDLSTSRTLEESGGAEDYIDTVNWTWGWTHAWNDRVSSRLSYTLLNEEYEGSTTDQDTALTSVGLTYNMRRWLTLGVEYSHKAFDSTTADDYDSNMLLFKVQASL